MYKLSIIIPTYNVENTITNAFDSIKDQSIGFDNIEVIIVDDHSNDNTISIAREYSREYSNVKFIFLDENSGFAGKPRNIGINNATTEYIMFLDPDDTYQPDACEKLYNTIIEYDCDIVSGNYQTLVNGSFDKINWKNYGISELKHVNDITQHPDLLAVPPSVWTKIIKKQFVKNNHIEFPEGIPGQDLVFVIECLTKSSNTVFIDEVLVKYLPSETVDNNNKHVSITSRKDKRVLSGFLEAYKKTYHILEKYNPELEYYAVRNLNFWAKQFCNSNLNFEDKLYLLNEAECLFKGYEKFSNLKPAGEYKSFFENVYKKDFINAVLTSQLIPYMNNNTKFNDFTSKIDIVMLFHGLDYNIGGLVKAVFNRVNMLKSNGHKITLLNTDPHVFRNNLANKFNNYNYIINYFKQLNILNKDIELFNIFGYYSDENTLDYNKKTNSIYYQEFSQNILIHHDYIITRKETEDKQVIYNYYYKSDFNRDEINTIESNISNTNFDINSLDHANKSLFRTESYIDDSLIVESIYENNQLAINNVLTPDGFIFYHEDCLTKRIYLNNRDNNTTKVFNLPIDFYDNFIYEYIRKLDTKPFLINDCSGVTPSIENINSKIAYKIGVMHSNHHEYPYKYGSPIRNFAVLNNIKDLDALITLTDAQKEDVRREFKISTIYTIQNSFNFKNIEKRVKTDPKKISIFSRISPEKNMSDLVKAMEIVRQEDPEIKLHIYGGATKPNEINELEKLKNIIKENNMKDTIIFEGHIEDVTKEMQESLLTILTSHIEGLPLVIGESMYNYTPVISYDTNYGPREFIDHHENGLIIEQYNVNELAQSIIYLANNPEIAEEYGRKAHETMINKFSDDIILKKWEEVLNKAYINHNMKLLNRSITPENKKYKNINVKPLKKENVINENIENSPSFISKVLSKNKKDSNKLKREYVDIRHKVTVIVDCRRKKKNDIIKLVNSMIKGSLKPSLIELVLITGEYMKVDYLYEVTKQYTNVHIMDINSNESIYEKVLTIIRTGYVLFINNIPSRNTLLEAYGKLVNGYDVVLINDINNFDMYSIENKLMKTEVFTNKNIIIDNNDVLTFNKDMFMDLNINKEDMLEYFLYDNNESREGIISTIRDNFINTNGPFKNDVFNRLKENVYKIIQNNRYDILINNSDKHRAFIEYITLSINKDDNKLKKLQDNISIDTPVTVLICIDDNPMNEVTQLLNIILRQSIEFEHLEIIFINNNSGAKTTERIKECCETYWNVKQIYLKTKHTIAECYNKGVDVTTSQYIILANKDHVLPNGGIKNIFRAIRKDNMNIAVGKNATKEENIYTYLFKAQYMIDNNIKFILDDKEDMKLSPDINTLRGVVNSDTIVTKK